MPPYVQAIPSGSPHWSNAQRSLARHELLKQLDLELESKWKPQMKSGSLAVPAPDHVLPYFLRSLALKLRLEPFELGRVFYHLSQRRGFKSNRKQTAKTKEQMDEDSKVYAGISEIDKQMKATGAPTLGHFFASADPGSKRIRGRWTARSMFEQEFDAIWKVQSAHYASVLTPDFRKQVFKLLYHQRPIAAQSHLIGECELEPGRKRAPLSILDAQRFRLLQKVNDLRIRFEDFTERPLSKEERGKLAAELENKGGLSFGDVRKLLGLPKRSVWFNLERGGEKGIPGNRTSEKMREAFEDRWVALTTSEKDAIIDEWRLNDSEEWLIRRGVAKWGLDEAQARIWAQAKPEDGYSRLSRQALKELIPLMEAGLSFKEAEKKAYGTRFSGGTQRDSLPPVRKALSALRNPAVERALSELRKVVNAILREHGKPFEVHIELARDLKQARQDRADTWKAMRARQDLRDKWKEKISIPNPSRADVERAMLWEECGGICPYTGRTIPFHQLFGKESQFDVEHILPFSRCPDDSFGNKTLCYNEENRTVKKNRTPWEAYGSDPQKWEQILARVRRFKRLSEGKPSKRTQKGKEKGDQVEVPGKLKRFLVKTQEELDQFSSRQLNDTRYASKLAAEYIGVLFGGRDLAQPEGAARRVVYTSPGGLTAILRRNWGLEEILREPEPAKTSDQKAKPRGDHRHHAIDAIVIALTTAGAVKALSDAVDRNQQRGRTSFKGTEGPWPDFVDSIRPHIESLIVSHRPEHKLQGQLHDETLYSDPYEQSGKSYVHVRKPVDALSAGEVEGIVDHEVRKAVEKRLKELGDLKKLRAEGIAPPSLNSKKGGMIPIRRVRIRKVLSPLSVGEEPRMRNVAPNNNHHMEIVAELDEREREIRWDGVPVSLMSAMERRKKELPIVRRDHGKTTRFKFTLMGGDTIAFVEDGSERLYVVRTIASNGQISLARVNDARLIKEIKESGDWWSPRADALRKLSARKVTVDCLGRVHPAND
jgi:CRISPR-associated endonuclease Csn1